MSRQTPRKARHRQQLSTGSATGRGVQQSDYESDAAHYLPAQTNPAVLAAMSQRTNTELNLSVLQRYLPSITSIQAMASNAVVYVFDTTTQGWEKSGVEGTMFICQQAPLVAGEHALPRACVFILNRKGLDNAIIDLAKVDHCEFNAELIIMRLEEATSALKPDGVPASPDAPPKVLGLWVHTDETQDREEVQKGLASRIENLWGSVKEAAAMVQAAEKEAPGIVKKEEESVGPALQAMGRRVSISELFAHNNKG